MKLPRLAKLKSGSFAKEYYHTHVRHYPYFFLKPFWHTTFILVAFAIVVLLSSLFSSLVSAATYTFSQTSWSGGASTNVAVHPDNQNDWALYSAKDSNLSAVNDGADLQLTTTTASITQTSDDTTTSGFNLSGAALSNTAISGLGTNASVKLSVSNSVTPMISGGLNHTLGLKSDGTVWSWGYNSQGQLGNGTITAAATSTPAKVVDPSDGTGFLTGVVAVAAGANISGAASSYALKANGTVLSWGYNGNGQLGRNGTSASGTPGLVTGLTGVTGIAAGTSSVYVIKSNGTVWAWGRNDIGQLGDGTTNQAFTPVQVRDTTDPTGYLTGVTSISTNGVGSNSTSVYVLKSNGTVWAWGKNDLGQLGDNTTTDRTAPVQVHGPNNVGYLTGITAVTSGSASGHALKSDGTVWGWGRNNLSQLGDGTFSDKLTPVQVVGVSGVGFLTDVTSVKATSAAVYVLKSDDSMWSWGRNNYGQLGINSTVPSATPTQVFGVGGSGTLTSVSRITASPGGAFAIKTDGTVVGWGYNVTNQVGNASSSSYIPAPANVLTAPSSSNFNVGFPSYNTPGTFTSGVIDLGANVSAFTTLGYTSSTPGGTTLSIVVRAGNSSNTADPSWTSYTSAITNGGSISSLGTRRYVQYKATLTSPSDPTYTPSLDDVTFNYTSYPASQTLTSSAYDTTDASNIIGSIAYNEDETLPTGTGVTFSVRTASTQAGLTAASWSNFTNATSGCTKDTTLVSCPAEAIPSVLKSGGNDRWWQYKVTLTSSGINTPTVSAVEVTYIVNAPPEVQNITAVQGNDGLVTVTYEVKDPDTESGGNTPNYITPTFEYWDGTSWITMITLSSGATDNKSVLSDSFNEYTFTWNPKTDFNARYMTNAKVRVRVNDNEAVNNTDSGESASFTLDTKDPIINSFVLDVRSGETNQIVSSVTENTLDGLKIKISNNSDLTPDEQNSANQGGEWIDYTPSSSWVFDESNPTVYYQVKDKYGNISGNNTIASVSAPLAPQNAVAQDASNADTQDWRTIIAWGRVSISSGFKQYTVYRSIDGTSYSQLVTKTNSAENFILDVDNLDPENTYYYRITAEDNAGNISAYSNVVSIVPDGDIGDLVITPIISNVSISEITTQSARITWDTDIPSDSRVYYITNDSGDFTSAPSVGVASLADSSSNLGQHSVSLSGLEDGETYYIRVSSVSTNTSPAYAGEGMSFETISGPSIYDVETTGIYNFGATVSWSTSLPSDSHVYYSKNLEFTNVSEVSDNDETTSHTLNVSELLPNTRYYFYVKSDVTEDKNISNGETSYYTFKTTSDSTGPVITFDGETDISEITETTARISWTTNESSVSSVLYSTDTSYGEHVANDNYNTSHSIKLTGLTKGTVYNFLLRSTDTNGNTTTESGNNFTTVDLSDVVPPEVEHVNAEKVFDTTAVITWDTNEPANSLVEYGTESGVYTKREMDASYNYSHSVILSDLEVDTTYYFNATSVDNNNNSTSSTEFSFTTLSRLTSGGSSSGDGGSSSSSDTTPPLISNVFVKDILGNKVTVTWDTNESADGAVEFGTTNAYGLAAIHRSLMSAHELDLTLLKPNTPYFYRITSSDDAGNLSNDYVGTFTTGSTSEELDLDSVLNGGDNDSIFSDMLNSALDLIKNASKKVSMSALEDGLLDQKNKLQDLAGSLPAPKLVVPPSIKVWEDMAMISWETDKKTSSLLAYGEAGFSLSDAANVYVVGDPSVYTIKHQVILPGLKADTKYNYQLRGETNVGSKMDVKPDTFTTLTKAAKVNNYVADRLTDSSASFKWASSVETDTSVRLTPYRNNALSFDEAKVTNDKKMTTIHEMTVTNFEPGIFYKVDLFGNDATGRTLSQTIEAFSTASTELPFIIEQVKTSSALAVSGGSDVQSIISWNTTKLSTSKVYYRKGTSKDDTSWPFESSLDEGYTRNHLVVMTDFEPGQVYQFQVESVDSNGVKIRSKSYTILTPRQKDSVFQVIFKNIEQTFGWVGGRK